MADDRRLKVLSAIVTDYVRTREPVGSRALVERYQLGVSPATIRNDMAALESEGYIHQPHTSAGRIPTQKGYRLFVDEVARIKPLSAPERAAITALLSGEVDLEAAVARAVRVLAQLTGQLAVVEYPSLRATALRHLELVVLDPRRVLVVIITDTGRVEQRTVMLSPTSRGGINGVGNTGDAAAAGPASARPSNPSVDQAQVGAPGTAAGTAGQGGIGSVDGAGGLVDPVVVERLRARLNNALVGQRAEQVLPALADLAAHAPGDERQLLAAVSQVLVEALRPDAEERLAVAGTANLARSTPDFRSLGALLDAVEEQVVLLRLLADSATATAGSQSPDGMRVSIGAENRDSALAEASVVSTAYGAGPGETVAHLGVVGPTRMDYPATMTAVRAVARYLSRFLAGGQSQ